MYQNLADNEKVINPISHITDIALPVLSVYPEPQFEQIRRTGTGNLFSNG